jgi:hypothetical protein
MGRGRVSEFQCSFSAVLSSWGADIPVRRKVVATREGLLTFSEQWQVDFDDLAIETEDGLEVGFDDVSGQIIDDDDFCIWFSVDGCRAAVNVHFSIANGPGGR